MVSVVAAVAVAAATVVLLRVAAARRRGPRRRPGRRQPARQPATYLGAYVTGVPASYAPISLAGRRDRHPPNVALYYSGWGEPFRAGFAGQAARHGAVPLVQIDPARSAWRSSPTAATTPT